MYNSLHFLLFLYVVNIFQQSGLRFIQLSWNDGRPNNGTPAALVSEKRNKKSLFSKEEISKLKACHN